MAKKTDEKKIQPVYLAAVLDRSGSMQNCKTDIEGAWANLVREQRKVPGKMKVSLYQFDYGLTKGGGTGMRFETVFENRNIHDDHVDELELTPDGLTPLWDAVAVTIHRTDAAVATAKTKPQVVLAVMTDGLNNSSREYSKQQVKDLVKARQDDGWVVTFLGEGLDAAAQGEAIGVAAAATMDFMEGSAGQAVGAMSAYLLSNRGQAASGPTGQSASWAAGYTPEQRAAAGSKRTGNKEEDEKK